MLKKMILLFLLCCSCATTKVYFPLNAPNDHEAIVQFIRPYILPTGFPIQVFVDGKKAVSLPNKAEVSFSIPSGEHEIVMAWPPGSLGVGRLSQKLIFTGGESRHFLLRDKSVIVGETMVNKNRFYLQELSEEESIRIVKSLE